MEYNVIKFRLFTLVGVMIFMLIIIFGPGIIRKQLGYPSIKKNISNKNSILLDYLLDHNDFDENWKLSTVNTTQYDEAFDDPGTSVINLIQGEYKSNKFILVQEIWPSTSSTESISIIKKENSRKYESEEFSYQAVYFDEAHNQCQISIYCYNMAPIENIDDKYTSCSIYRINSDMYEDVFINFGKVIDIDNLSNIIADLQTVMKNNDCQ